MKFPADSRSRRIGSKARAIVHYSLNSDRWEYHESTGIDVGIDCHIETPENNLWKNLIIDCQIKGTRKPTRCRNDYLSFPLEVKAISYALSDCRPFVLFLVDVENEIVFYLPIQDYFIKNKELLDKLEQDQKTLSVHIPTNSTIELKETELLDLARCSYSCSSANVIEKHCPKCVDG